MRHTFEGFALYYLKEQKRKAARTKAFTDARGDDYGRAPFGYVKRTPGTDGTDRVVIEKVDEAAIQRVIDAYTTAGTYLGAAGALNDAGEPTANGVGKWYATAVERIIRRNAPELLPARPGRGKRPTGRPRLFAGLLRCPCGTTLTPGGIARKPVYYCWRARANNAHPAKASIAESRLLPWVRDEADRLVDPDEYTVTEGVYDDSADRRRLEAARDLMTDDAYAEAVARLDAKRIETGERVERLLDVPDRVDWERWDAEGTNRALRSLWEFVELGPDLQPVRAEWRHREWRRE